MTFWWIFAIGLLLAAGTIGVWRPLRSIIREVHAERALELFQLHREHLEAEFQEKAAASGKPRGLRWKQCAWESEVRLARERHGGVIALVPVNISFEAVEGSDMEGLPAVGNLRTATAVFSFARGRWHTDGRALFNMNPSEALGHLQNQVTPIE